MDKETWDRMIDVNKQPEWAGTPVKQVRLMSGKDLNRLQSDINQELLTLTLAHNQIENVRTYSDTFRYIGEITYITYTRKNNK